MSKTQTQAGTTQKSAQRLLVEQLPSSTNTFHLGFSMAGAISAGAYTAGVMDYLLEALDRWEASKKSAAGKVPGHHIKIDVMGGASAGGMTAALASVAAQGPVAHINDRLKLNDNDYTSKNLMYNCWVNLITDYALTELLDLSDITDNNVVSLLNSNLVNKIGDIVEEAIRKIKEPTLPVYFDNEPEFIVSLSNLTGIPFKVTYDGTIQGAETYIARRDFAHFKIMQQDNDAWPGRIPLYLKPKVNTKILVDAAKATGAFPVGLSSRFITRPKKYVEENPYINQDGAALDIPDPYKTLNVDGGVFNNDPLHVTRQILKEIVNSKTKAPVTAQPVNDTQPQPDDKGANCAVIMVDPFPSVDDGITAPKKEDTLLTNIIQNLIMSMRSQLLFDVQDIHEAMDEHDYNTFLVAPKRNDIENSKAIACGALGGFGGFLKKDFRVHDFFLGRRNCQQFLKQHLALPMRDVNDADSIENPVLTNGYPATLRDKFKIKGEKGKYYLPLIPDVNEQGDINNKEEEALPFPKLSEDELQQYHSLVAKRFEKIVANIGLTDGKRFIATCAAIAFKGTVADKVLDYIRDDLKSRSLYKQ